MPEPQGETATFAPCADDYAREQEMIHEVLLRNLDMLPQVKELLRKNNCWPEVASRPEVAASGVGQRWADCCDSLSEELRGISGSSEGSKGSACRPPGSRSHRRTAGQAGASSSSDGQLTLVDKRSAGGCSGEADKQLGLSDTASWSQGASSRHGGSNGSNDGSSGPAYTLPGSGASLGAGQGAASALSSSDGRHSGASGSDDSSNGSRDRQSRSSGASAKAVRMDAIVGSSADCNPSSASIDSDRSSAAQVAHCLPPDALVLIEGTGAEAIGALVPGQRVLCFDCLGDRERYVEVVSVQQKQRKTHWVQARFQDGTAARMTEHYPMRLAGRPSLLQVLCARLVPSKSSIIVRRETAVPVQVIGVDKVSFPSAGVSVRVRHPDRHSILVAFPSEPHSAQSVRTSGFVALGSADLAPPPFRAFRTFLHPLAKSKGVQCRPHSWPPSSNSELPIPQELSAIQDDSLSAAEDQQESSSKGFSTGSTEGSSACSEPSDEDTLILLPWTRAVGRAAPKDGSAAAFMLARSNSWDSIGSVGHWEGVCNPCSYAHRNRCSRGMWCQRCHGKPHVKANGKILPVHPNERAKLLDPAFARARQAQSTQAISGDARTHARVQASMSLERFIR